MTPLERWTDERLDDRFASIDRTLQRLDQATAAVSGVPTQLAEVSDDAHECRTALRELRSQLEERRRERERERQAALELRVQEQKQAEQDRKVELAQAAKDRRDTRRWIVGVALSTAAITVAALGLLFGVIGIAGTVG